MIFHVNGSDISKLEGYIFCDNDFLSALTQNETAMDEAIALFGGRLVLDPFTEMEFLRSVYLPEQILIKKSIIEKAFIVAEKNQEVLNKIFEQSMELSKIYAHKNVGIGSSLVDLFLAGRLANAGHNHYLVTGNSKDFPSIVFDVVAVINFEQKDGTMRAIVIKEFNKDKYQRSKEDYQIMISRLSIGA